MAIKTVKTQAGKYAVHLRMDSASSLTCTDLETVRQSIRDRMFTGSMILTDGTKASWTFIRQPKMRQTNLFGGI